MKQTAQVLNKLLIDGELNTSNSELLAEYRTPEVRTQLDIWGEEMGFSLLEMRGKVYLVPHADSELLSLTIRDLRESVHRSGRLIDVYLQSYITMIILWMFYGGKNISPKQKPFLQVKDIVTAIDERFVNLDASKVDSLESDYEINFTQIINHWNALPVYEESSRRTTRFEFVLRACRFLRGQNLLLILDGDREVRPTTKLDDLMIGHYLNMNRIEEIHKLFEN
jgi:hypothetical protein